MKEMKDKRDRDKRVVKALNEAAAVMQRMEDTGDIEGFAVITQQLGPVNKPGARSWKCVAVLPWRECREDAEDDLEVYAEAHGMKKVEE